MSRVGAGLPLFTELPRRVIPGNQASGSPSSRNLRRHKKRGPSRLVPGPLAQRCSYLLLGFLSKPLRCLTRDVNNHARLLTFDPPVVSWGYDVGVARSKLLLRAIVHGNLQSPCNYVAGVRDLAAIGPCDGLYVL